MAVVLTAPDTMAALDAQGMGAEPSSPDALRERIRGRRRKMAQSGCGGGHQDRALISPTRSRTIAHPRREITQRPGPSLACRAARVVRQIRVRAAAQRALPPGRGDSTRYATCRAWPRPTVWRTSNPSNCGCPR
jgi:hypothetical protein